MIHGSFPQADVSLIAPAGIEFGDKARLAVGGSFLATTGRLDKETLRFSGNQPGRIVNRGQLEVAAGKNLALVGSRLEQRGSLRTPGGNIVLATPVKGSGLRVQGSGFENEAPGNNPDFLTGLSFERSPRGGDAGLLEQVGTLDVTGDEPGGITLAAGLGFVGGDISANAFERGGNIALSGQQLILTGNLTADGMEGSGGSITVTSSIRTIQTSASRLAASGGRFGNGGLIAIRGGFERDTDGVFLSGQLAASTQGKSGGEISVSGQKLDVVDARLRASGPRAGGRISIGANSKGNLASQTEPERTQQTTVPSADSVYVSATSQLVADAGIKGQGGDILVWSAKATEIRGTVSAAGGPQGGEGGQVDVSGLGRVTMDGKPASHSGEPGRFLLDPKNIVVDDTAGVFPQFNVVDANPAGIGFGTEVVALLSGNLVITKPSANVGGVMGAGTVFLYHGLTGALVSMLAGGSEDDKIGSGVSGYQKGVTVLTNGNFVVCSPYWDNGTEVEAGATTWGSGVTGISGVVSPVNSLVGSQVGDVIGYNGVTALTNGNYVVSSPFWNNGEIVRAGAATWGNGTTGISGKVSVANSLVGGTTSGIGSKGIIALTNGNYVVNSPFWNNDGIEIAGAVTWGDGTTGITGVVSATNSLVGSQPYDHVGFSGVTALTNGNYVVSSQFCRIGSGNGAVTWGDGRTGITGVVSIINSLVGSHPGDFVGDNGVTALTNGNFVVNSPLYNNGGVNSTGAVTWGNGTIGITGEVNAANSLVGIKAGDRIGYSGVTALTNGNYVVGSPFWDGKVIDAGAVTWGNGTTGISGVVSADNSLVGGKEGDKVSISGVTALKNGNYVVASPNWDSGMVVDAGAVTWGSGSAATTGEVGPANSLIGSKTNDFDSIFVVALTNGNYVVGSPKWDNGTVIDVGAVIWGNGTAGLTGTISSVNSLVGSKANDKVGFSGVTALTNGNYIVGSHLWDNGTVVDAGAVTWGNGTIGLGGTVNTTNSLVGSATFESIGYKGIALTNGNFVVISLSGGGGAVTWINGNTGKTLTGVGSVNPQNGILLSFSTGSVSQFVADDLVNGIFGISFSTFTNSGKVFLGLSNPNPNQLTYSRWQGGTTTITTAFLTNLLNIGTPVTLQASNDITLNSPLTTTGNGNLTLQAGRSVQFRQPVTLANGDLTVIANDQLSNGVVNGQRDPGPAVITATQPISVGSGTATFDLRNGAGKTYTSSGNVQLLTVQAGGISITNNGPTPGSGISVKGTLASGPCAGASLCTAGGSGGITINHPNSQANFVVGDAATNGTAGSLVTSATTVPVTSTVVNKPGSFTQGNVTITPGCNGPSQPSPIRGSTSVCPGATNVMYSVANDPAATSYVWSYSGTGMTLNSTTNMLSASFSPTATPGVLRVIANNGCSSSPAQTLTLVANSAPSLGTYPSQTNIIAGTPLTITPNVPPLDNEPLATVTVVASAGYTGPLSVHPITGVVTTTPIAPGTFTLTVTAVDTCGVTTTSSCTISVLPFGKGPQITGISPAAGPAGSPVTLTGVNLDKVTTVQFNGTVASFTIDSASQITATVPKGATTGPVTAGSPTGTGVGPVFTVIRTK
ncbi:MAG: hypothetical protein K1Y36_06370 [Blastocatellia bacterium]|nr:hypothetical protein [Blastocatellia bacterium]